MQIIKYYQSENQAHWREEIGKGDWSAAKLLHDWLESGKLKQMCGDSTEVYLLTDGDKLVSFATLAPQDEIDAPKLSPWIGFVYTFPAYRGHRNAGKLLTHICEILKSAGSEKVYISSDETGLYEKYGFTFWQTMTNRDNKPTRVYVKKLYNLEDLMSEFAKVTAEIKDGKKIDSDKERAEVDRTILAKYLWRGEFNDEEYMYLICTLLNSFCSTRMGADRVYATAKEFKKSAELIKTVLSKEDALSDEYLNKIQEALCQKIQLEEQEGRKFTPYSFVTKFLAFHSEYSSIGDKGISLFPIYDSQVGAIITKYGLKDKQTLEKFINRFTFTEKEEVCDLFNYFEDIRTIDLRNYPQFYKLMRILSLSTGLNLTQLDRFLWKLGDRIQKS